MPMADTFRIATWNINSVRLRIGLVERFLKTYEPDVLCLQETKCPDANFPFAAIRKTGYEHIAIRGQKGYHGVAIISRRPFLGEDRRQFCGMEDARHVSVDVDYAGKPLTIHNFYVPAGGDDPNPDKNPKFAHKLSFIEEMKGWLTGKKTAQPSILVGDLNIAPKEQDVWSHKQLLRVVSHTPVETDGLNAVQAAGPWVDAMRHFVPDDTPLFTWWSYRSPNWQQSNKGRRLDHVWVTPHLEPALKSMEVVKEARSWEKPSDHAPVIVDLAG